MVMLASFAGACSGKNDDTSQAVNGGSTGGSDATCGEAACGGDVVGTWQVDELCGWPSFQESFQDADCTGSSVELLDLAMNGTFTYRPAGTYTASLKVTGSFQLNYPSSCLQGGTCAQFDAELQDALVADPESGIRAVSCKGSKTCECVADLRPNTTDDTGTYETNGHVLTMTSDEDGKPSKVNYCASGKTMYMAEDNRGESPELVLRKK